MADDLYTINENGLVFTSTGSTGFFELTTTQTITTVPIQMLNLNSINVPIPNTGYCSLFFDTNETLSCKNSSGITQNISSIGLTGPVGPSGPSGPSGPTGPTGTMNIQNYESNSQTIASTTSTNFVDIPDTNVTVINNGFADYLIFFNGDSYKTGDASKIAEFIINVDGVDIISSKRIFVNNETQSNSTQCKVTNISNGSIIKVRYKTEQNTVFFINRSLIVIQL